MSIVFISYRRALSSDLARQVATSLKNRLPNVTPYLDVESIAGGINFVEAIETQIALADVLVVLIPLDWAEVRDTRNHLRLHQSSDHVRAEIAAALKRGVDIVPVLVDRLEMPDADVLPENMCGLSSWNAVPIRSELSDADAVRLSTAVRAKIPGRLTSILLSIVSMQSGLFMLPYFLIVVLILFASHLLQVHIIPTEETFAGQVGWRDLGIFNAVNWTVAMFLLWPLVLYCAHQVLSDAQSFISTIRERKLIVFVDPDGQRNARSPNELWRTILALGTPAIFGLIILSLLLASYNAYDFSGQWSATNFPLEEFHRVSTGVDWQVAWAIDVRFAENAFAIKVLAFVCYNLYDFGWVMGYAILVFAAIFAAQLERVAEGSGNYRADRLIVDKDAEWTGGFDALDRMQRSLGLVALASSAAMYLISIRNYFLPPGCQAVSLPDGSELTAHCFSTLGIFKTSAAVLQSTFASSSWFDPALLFAGPAVRANSFTIGTVFAIILTLTLFTYVNAKLGRIVRRSRANTGLGGTPSPAARPLTRVLRRRGLLIQHLLLATAAASVWPNLSVLYVMVVAIGAFLIVRPAVAT